MIFMKTRKYDTEELVRLVNALIEAPTSPDTDVLDQYKFIVSKFKTLDKIPYSDGMKLVELMDHTKDSMNNDGEHQ